jgi:hypothetical protein
VVAVELADALLADQLDREMPLVDPRRAERSQRRIAQLLGRTDELQVDQVADPEAACPRGRPRASWRPNAAEADSSAIREDVGGRPAQLWGVIRGCGDEGSATS